MQVNKCCYSKSTKVYTYVCMYVCVCLHILMHNGEYVFLTVGSSPKILKNLNCIIWGSFHLWTFSFHGACATWMWVGGRSGRTGDLQQTCFSYSLCFLELLPTWQISVTPLRKGSAQYPYLSKMSLIARRRTNEVVCSMWRRWNGVNTKYMGLLWGVYVVPQTKRYYTGLGCYSFLSAASHFCGWYSHPHHKTSSWTLPTIALVVTFCECTTGGTGTKGDTHWGQGKGRKGEIQLLGLLGQLWFLK